MLNFTSCDRQRPPAAAAYRQWLRDRGSLTSRIQSRCRAFSVKVVFQGLRRADRDERFLFPQAGRRLMLVREVYLYCRRTPVVFAHSVLDPRDLRGTWRRLAGLGSRPLGAALFADPRIRRYPLRQKKIHPHHELHRRAAFLGARNAFDDGLLGHGVRRRADAEYQHGGEPRDPATADHAGSPENPGRANIIVHNVQDMIGPDGRLPR